MPKIFLIKNRLHQQQLRLLENQNANVQKNNELGIERNHEPSPPDSPQPLSLIVPKKDDDKKDTVVPEEDKKEETPRRFISSILGGDVPYGSRGHVLTRAERKEYPPITPKVVLPTTDKPKDVVKPQNLAPVRHFSVIQRTPKASKREEDTDVRLPTTIQHQEPEQDQPIDYHIPKRRGEVEDDEEERRSREQRRSHHKITKPIVNIRKIPLNVKCNTAAAGHGRSGNSNSGNGGGNGGGTTGGGGSINFTSTGGGATGGMSSGTGGGGMNPGRDGRQNYGPSSPPTGSLPPFYESLKGGNNNFNANNQFGSSYLNMDTCDTGQDLGLGHASPKQYSTLQNASYGIIMKDETDLDLYEGNQINQLLPSGYSGYDDSMMVDMVTGAVVDPLQFTFSSSAEHALLESLTDASDLTTFLQRLPSEEQNDNEDEPSLEQNIDSFNDQMLSRNTPGYNQFNKMYPPEPLPSYNGSGELQQMQQQQQQMLSPPLSFNGSALDLDSPTTMSLPSPAASCSLDGDGTLSPPAQVSAGGRRKSSSSLPGVNVLHSKLGLSNEVQLEFVNGGHGIKNPLANQEPVRQGPRTEDKVKVASVTSEDGQTTFCCKICNKTFTLQRLLNRHMKCHSDVKRYLCTFCGKGFNDTFDLKRHTRTHTGVRPYKCALCEKSFTQRCSLESHCLKVHGVQHQYAYKERRTKVYVCEECGHTTSEPEVHYLHLKEKHPYSPALLKFYDKRHFKFTNSNFANMLLQVRT